jgi:hypothetical protein
MLDIHDDDGRPGHGGVRDPGFGPCYLAVVAGLSELSRAK